MTVRLASAAALLCLVALRGPLLSSQLETVSWVMCAVVALAVTTVARTAPLGLWSAGFWYIVVLAIFHLGLAIPLGLGYELEEGYATYAANWFGSTSFRVEATYLSGLAVSGTACAYAWIARETHRPPERHVGRGAEAVMGFALVGTGFVITLGLLLASPGAGLFDLTRQAYTGGAANSTVGAIASFLVAFGGFFLAAASPSALRRAGFVLLLVFGLWALLVGARSLIMYPALAMVVAVARVRPMPRDRIAVLLLVGGLIVVALVSSYRVAGLANTTLSLRAVNPMAGVTEMGGSIRPLVENVKYSHALNEAPSGGATYTGVLSRGLESILGLPRPVGTEDPRLAGNELRQRVDTYQIGYSAVAEAYRNWRTAGVLGVFLCFGALLGFLDSWRLKRPLPAVFAAIVFYALTYHVRQPSIQVIPLLVVGATLVWLCAALNARTPSQSEPVGVGHEQALQPRIVRNSTSRA